MTDIALLTWIVNPQLLKVTMTLAHAMELYRQPHTCALFTPVVHAPIKDMDHADAGTANIQALEIDHRPPDYLITDAQLNTDDIDYIINDIQDETSGSYNPPKTPMMYRRILNQIWPYADEGLWSEHPDYMRIYRRVCASVMPNYRATYSHTIWP